MALSILPRQTQQKKSGILGVLGTLASLGGTLTGQPWLTTLGMGMSGVDNVMNGGGGSVGGNVQTTNGTHNDLEEIVKKVKEKWKNPASGNVAKSADAQAREEIANRFGTIVQPIATAANSIGAVQPTGSNYPFPAGSNWLNGLGAGLQPDGSWIYI